jgi:hypothetical protein
MMYTEPQSNRGPARRAAGAGGLLLVTFFGLGLGLAACKKSAPPGASGEGDRAAAAAGSGGAPAANSGPSAADRAQQQKLHASIECLNAISGRIFEARATYLKEVDAEKGPAPGKQIYLLGITDSCKDRLAKAIAVTPAVPALDGPAAAYLAALGTLKVAWDRQSGYFQSGEFRTDGGKKGVEQHGQLMAALAGFAAANKQLDDEVQVENRARREADLAAREKAHGRDLSVILDTLMLEAETVIGQVPGKPEQVLRMDTTGLEAGMARYAKLVAEFDAYAVAHPDEAKTIGSLTNIRNYSQSFLGALRAVIAKVHDKAAPTADEMDTIGRRYNDLVDNYNHH